MKLLAKTNRYYLFYTVLLFLIGGVIFYFILRSIIREEVSEMLILELHKKEEEFNAQQLPPGEVNTLDYTLVAVTSLSKGRFFKDTLVYSPEDDEYIPYRQLSGAIEVQGHYYQLTLRKSLIASEDLLFAISLSLMSLFAIMLLGLFFVNNFLAKKLWMSFYQNLNLIKEYDVTAKPAVTYIATDIEEFQELNHAIRKMTEKIRHDYLSLKEFTENASHEMQTPLSVIRSNVDLQLQDQHLSRKQREILGRISKAIRRISTTNRALLLLTKIENNQFTALDDVDLKKVISDTLCELEELIHMRGLNVHFESAHYQQPLFLNPHLVKILIDNLLNNAVKHNIPHGFITIVLSDLKLEIVNSGPPLTMAPDKLFERFVKGNPASDSPGLGMAIVKKICDICHIRVAYHHAGTKHTISLFFQ